jgi:ssDNA-binding Zn-finger/Zn-ribbon topoisomerase 1
MVSSAAAMMRLYRQCHACGKAMVLVEIDERRTWPIYLSAPDCLLPERRGPGWDHFNVPT